jgi:hypothetical protein
MWRNDTVFSGLLFSQFGFIGAIAGIVMHRSGG